MTGPAGGVAELHALVARHAQDPGQVVVGIETDRGLLVGALLAAGYQVYAVNPLAVSRYRDRHVVSGASPTVVTPRCWCWRRPRRPAAIASALRQAGRKLRIQTRAVVIQAGLCAPQLDAPAAVATAYGQGEGVPGREALPRHAGHLLARGPAVQMGQRCREVKHDWTAGLVG